MEDEVTGFWSAIAVEHEAVRVVAEPVQVGIVRVNEYLDRCTAGSRGRSFTAALRSAHSVGPRRNIAEATASLILMQPDTLVDNARRQIGAQSVAQLEELLSVRVPPIVLPEVLCILVVLEAVEEGSMVVMPECQEPIAEQVAGDLYADSEIVGYLHRQCILERDLAITISSQCCLPAELGEQPELGTPCRELIARAFEVRPKGRREPVCKHSCIEKHQRVPFGDPLPEVVPDGEVLGAFLAAMGKVVSKTLGVVGVVAPVVPC